MTLMPSLEALDMATLARLHPGWLARLVEGDAWLPGRHLIRLGDELVRTARVGGRFVCSLHPQSGKSELASRFFPAWYLGTHPSHRVLFVSYSLQHATSWGAKVRDLLVEFGPQLWGVTVEGGRRASKGEFELVDCATGRKTGGGYLAVGTSGGLSGRRGDLLLVDDPTKDMEGAVSSVQREALWDWFSSVALTRLTKDAGVAVTATRWHFDDLVGRLEATGDWTVLNLPALAEADDPLGRVPGEALFPALKPREWLLKTRKAVGSYVWQSLYQGRPSPPDGGLFQRDWFRCWAPGDGTWNPKASCPRFGVADLAISTKASSDYSVAQTWIRNHEGKLVLLDQIRGRWEAPELLSRLAAFTREHQLGALFVESVAFQVAIVHMLRDRGVPVRELHPDKDKLTRALPLSALMEAGCVLFPKDAPWLGDFEEELLRFPNGRHDDQVDAAAYAALIGREFGLPPLPPVTSDKANGWGDLPDEDRRDAVERGWTDYALNPVAPPWL